MAFIDDYTGKSIIGVNLDGKTLTTGIVFNKSIVKSSKKLIDRHQSEEAILSELIHSVSEVFTDGVAGIGIGVPSLVDVNKGIVYRVQQIPSWKEVHLKEILESHFGVKVYVNNDANCFAVGEMYFGKAKGFENVVGLIIGQGVGSGIVFKGHLYSGTNCGAGEIGSIPYKDYDFEYYCSESFFDEKYGLNFETILERVKKKDKIALAIFEQYGIDLGNLIKAILYTLDPEIIILGGSISQAFPYFEKSMKQTVNTFTYKHSLKKLSILTTEQPEIAILGAAALYYDAQNKSVKK
jgi:glucokinase